MKAGVIRLIDDYALSKRFFGQIDLTVAKV